MKLRDYSKYYYEERDVLRFIIDDLDDLVAEEMQEELMTWARRELERTSGLTLDEAEWSLDFHDDKWKCDDGSSIHCCLVLDSDLLSEDVYLWIGTTGAADCQAAATLRALLRLDTFGDFKLPRGRGKDSKVAVPWDGKQPIDEYLAGLMDKLLDLRQRVEEGLAVLSS